MNVPVMQYFIFSLSAAVHGCQRKVPIRLDTDWRYDLVLLVSGKHPTASYVKCKSPQCLEDKCLCLSNMVIRRKTQSCDQQHMHNIKHLPFHMYRSRFNGPQSTGRSQGACKEKNEDRDDNSAQAPLNIPITYTFGQQRAEIRVRRLREE